MYIENDCLYISTEEYLAAGEWFEIMGLIEEGNIEVIFTQATGENVSQHEIDGFVSQIRACRDKALGVVK